MARINGGQYRWKPGRVFLRCTRCRGPIKGNTCAGPACKRNRGRWYFVFDKGPRGIPGNQVMRGGYKSREDALAAMHTLQGQLRTGEYIEPTDQTLEQYLRRWLAGIGHDVRDGTWLNYRSDINRIVPLIGSWPLPMVTARVLIDAYNKLAETGYKTTTVQKSHLVLHTALKHAVQDGLIRNNPAQGAFRHRIRTAETDCLTEAEAHALLAAERGAREYAAWRLLLIRGLRPGELCALQCEDVDLTTGRLQVRYTLSLKVTKGTQVQAKLHYELDEPKTEAGRRDLDLDPETVAALRAYRAQQQQEKAAMGLAYHNQGYFFAGADGRPWNPNTLAALFRRRLRKAGLREVRLYALRHTAASVASFRRVPLKDISEMLGHSSIRSTARYLHTLPGSSARTAQTIASAIDNAGAEVRSQEVVDNNGDDRIMPLADLNFGIVSKS